ncbi:unnamed protein product [Protopolystoma xenopodis]|uniref:Uncharacterized protein n=1 Tax=Protopolystoma xenopodis TaxID=117903 RepID=A0A448XA99_9PLAT|nr:unnamed protein product [Protopolystoma xenopodis]
MLAASQSSCIPLNQANICTSRAQRPNPHADPRQAHLPVTSAARFAALQFVSGFLRNHFFLLFCFLLGFAFFDRMIGNAPLKPQRSTTHYRSLTDEPILTFERLGF